MTKINEGITRAVSASNDDDGTQSLPINLKVETKKNLSLKNITQIVYLCQALSFFFGITAIAGIILNYLKRKEVKDSWLESHFCWQIRTFWIGLAASFAGFILMFVIVGFLILAIILVWSIHRVIKGYLLLNENKPIENPQAFI